MSTSTSATSSCACAAVSGSDAVVDAHHARVLGAARAAVERVVVLGAVADDAAAAMRAHRREALDRTFERIERAAAERSGEREGLVVVVAADVASGHGQSPPGKTRVWT